MLGRSNDHDPFLLQIDSIVSSEAVIYARLPSLFPCRAGWAFVLVLASIDCYNSTVQYGRCDVHVNYRKQETRITLICNKAFNPYTTKFHAHVHTI